MEVKGFRPSIQNKGARFVQKADFSLSRADPWKKTPFSWRNCEFLPFPLDKSPEMG